MEEDMTRMNWDRVHRSTRNDRSDSYRPAKAANWYRHVYAIPEDARVLDHREPPRPAACGEPVAGSTPVELAMARRAARDAHAHVVVVRRLVNDGQAGAAELHSAQWTADQASQLVMRLERGRKV